MGFFDVYKTEFLNNGGEFKWRVSLRGIILKN
jgi:hypothetical protein